MIVTENNKGDFGLESIDYNPSIFFKNGHISTMYPYVLRKKIMPNYTREKWTTIDQDFIHIDIIKRNSKTAIILLHGLEGSSLSQYILGIINSLKNLDCDIYAMNHRSCSGEINLTHTMYHSGFTTDVTMVINRLNHYDKIAVVGFSLGGNMILKYLGNNVVPSNLKSAIAISVPVDLVSSAIRLNHWSNRAYAIQFLSTLMKKGKEKARQFPDLISVKELRKVKNLKEYDDVVTAPLHGYKNADDYYLRASIKPELNNISIPTLLLNAHNDTFLAPPCFPFEIADGHEHFHFLSTKYGGHVGFGDWSRSYSFSDDIAVDWLKKYLF